MEEGMNTWPEQFRETYTEAELREASEWADRQPEGSISRQAVGACLIFNRAFGATPPPDSA